MLPLLESMLLAPPATYKFCDEEVPTTMFNTSLEPAADIDPDITVKGALNVSVLVMVAFGSPNVKSAPRTISLSACNVTLLLIKSVVKDEMVKILWLLSVGDVDVPINKLLGSSKS